MRRSRQMLPLLVALLIPGIAWGLGADHPPGPLGGTGAWPKGLTALVNTDHRVHGYFVNSEDIMFFRGDTAKLNNFLSKFSQLENANLKVILHPGKLDVNSPWDKKPRDLQADWRVYAGAPLRKSARFAVRVEIWLGGQVNLKELRVPANVPVVSGGEIEAFVEKHQQTQAPTKAR